MGSGLPVTPIISFRPLFVAILVFGGLASAFGGIWAVSRGVNPRLSIGGALAIVSGVVVLALASSVMVQRLVVVSIRDDDLRLNLPFGLQRWFPDRWTLPNLGSDPFMRVRRVDKNFVRVTVVASDGRKLEFSLGVTGLTARAPRSVEGRSRIGSGCLAEWSSRGRWKAGPSGCG